MSKTELIAERKGCDVLYGPSKESKPKEKTMADNQFDNTNRGAIFPNGQKARDTQPDWSGPLNFEGIELRLAGWIREGRNGEFISLKVERMDDAREKNDPVKGGRMVKRNDDENIPF